MSLTDELDLPAAFIHDPCIGTPVDLLEDSNEQIVTQGCVRLLTIAMLGNTLLLDPGHAIGVGIGW
jgi:hypothetical protein